MNKYQESNISLHYSSEDPENPLFYHQIDLEQLAPILLNTSKMLRAVNRIYNTDDQEIRVRIGEGAVKKGSLEVVIQILQNPEAVSVLKAMGLTAVAGSVTVAGAMSVIKKLKGRKIRAVKRLDDSNQVEIESIDGEKIECSQSDKRLVTDANFRKHLDQVLATPFTSVNAEKISIGLIDGVTQKESLLEIGLNESDSMSMPDEIFYTEIKERSIESNVKFKTASVKDSNDWIVEIGQKERKVEVLDQNFLSSLEDSTTPFNFGLVYKALVTETKTLNHGTGRSKVEYKIEKVYLK